MNILGIDLGNAVTKTSTGVRFESKLKQGITVMNKNDIKVVYEGIEYTIGSPDGALNIGSNKYKKNTYKIELLTAIAMSFKTEIINTKIVVGVPVRTFNDEDYTNEILDIIESWGKQKIEVNGVQKTINIKEVSIFAESALVFGDKEKYKNLKTLIVDLGGSTIDWSLWNGLREENSDTEKMGMISLYKDIAKAVNKKFTLNLKEFEVKDMIGKKIYNINQKMEDISFIDTIIELYINKITSYIDQQVSISKVDEIEIIGGGAIQLQEWLNDEFEGKGNISPDADFANAINYKKVGELMWE